MKITIKTDEIDFHFENEGEVKASDYINERVQLYLPFIMACITKVSEDSVKIKNNKSTLDGTCH